MIDKKQIAWQNIYTSNIKGKILKGTAIAIETEKITVIQDGKRVEKEVESLIVNFKHIKVLIPAEEIKDRKMNKRDLRNMIGSELRFIVLKIDKLTNKAVGSRKKALEKMRKIELKKYKQEENVFARIISVYPKVLDVECLGVDLRLKVEDLEYGYVTSLIGMYQVGDKIKVKIKEIDAEKEILKVSHKDTKQDPYKVARVSYVEGGEYLGIITGYSDNGVFVKLEQGIDAMATLPTWMEIPPEPGDKVVIRIKTIDAEKRRIFSSLLRVARRENIE